MISFVSDLVRCCCCCCWSFCCCCRCYLPRSSCTLTQRAIASAKYAAPSAGKGLRCARMRRAHWMWLDADRLDVSQIVRSCHPGAPFQTLKLSISNRFQPPDHPISLSRLCAALALDHSSKLIRQQACSSQNVLVIG